MDHKLALDQLTLSNNGINRLSVMIGAKHFAKGTDDQGRGYVSFKFMQGAKNGANYCKITLTFSDTYNVELGKIWGHNYKVVSSVRGLYAEDLYNHFTSETGMALKL